MQFQLAIATAEPAHIQVEKYFRRRIQTAELKPGQRLPPNMELARRFGVSCTVIQTALANLNAVGLLERAPRRGTFVRSQTDRVMIGALFGPSLANEKCHFYRAMHTAIQGEAQARAWGCQHYDGLSESKANDRDYRVQTHQHLVGDLRNYAFKGLLMIAPDTQWPKRVQALVDLPTATWDSSHKDNDIALDTSRFTRESVEFLARRGRKRLLYLRSAWHRSQHTADLDGFWDACSACDIRQPRVEPIEITGDDQDLEHMVYKRVLRLAAGWTKRNGKSGAPDALLVNDDVLMRAVALALLKAGITVPSQVLIVCQTMREVALHYGLDVVRYEFSTREIAGHLLEILWKRIRSQAVSRLPILVCGQIRAPAYP